MMENTDPKKWAEEFRQFLNAPEVKPPSFIQNEIFNTVRGDLNPSLSRVMTKLAAIHVFAGSISLLLCSQFGIGMGYSVAHSMMVYGVSTCMAFCGALFLSLTVVAAGFVLSTEELMKIRKTCYSPILLLGIGSLMLFLTFGAEIALHLALSWLMGGLLAGAVFTEASLNIKRVLPRQ